MIKLKNICKTYQMGEEQIKALDNVSLSIKDGDYISIEGPSGSGKSTLMNIIGLLDVADSGSYLLDGEDIGEKSDNELAEIRNRTIGFVFQNFNLISKMSALENVMVPLMYKGLKEKEAEKTARSYLEKVGLADRENHIPTQLSGGQQQRVAIARALCCQPEVILADEPTGALDQKTGRSIMDLLEELNSQGQTIIVITHDHSIALRAKRYLKIQDGVLTSGGERNERNQHVQTGL